tara:strand:- start:3066 stop:3299 length:234 start_codon:yes stop_codon:yes gene_type:complete
MRILMIILMFFLIGGFFIISNEDLSLGNSEERMQFGEMYFTWLSNVFGNIGAITGDVVKLEWLPGSDFEREDRIGFS